MGGTSKGYHVMIDRTAGRAKFGVYFFKEASPDWLNATVSGDGGVLVWTPFKEGDPVEPLMYIHAEEMPLLEAMANAMRDAGVVTTDENRLQGMLDAKDDHLQDMRHLLKLPKKSLPSSPSTRE